MNDRILLGTRKGMLTLRRENGSWRLKSTDFLGDPVTITLVDERNDSMFAALKLGHFGVKLRRSQDGGASWEELETPAYPPKPDDVHDVDPNRKTPIPWSTVQIWDLAASNDVDPDLMWCGTIPGGLFRSDDGGTTWELVRSLWDRPERAKWCGGGADFAGIHSICPHPEDNNHVVVGVSIGGVWTTTDGGESWENTGQGLRAEYMPPDQAHDLDMQDPHRIVQSASNPDVYWIQHHNGIFHSTDGARSWREIENVDPSTFGFAVAVHPFDPKTAWFVPAQKDECRVPVDRRVVVTRTRDGGESFEVLTKGLPQENAYDLVYRHALDVDESGKVLVFGSTTGNLWISEDAGDSWTHVQGHLPPIYSVRIG